MNVNESVDAAQRLRSGCGVTANVVEKILHHETVDDQTLVNAGQGNDDLQDVL
jgi:hypothetical protein